MDLARNLKIDSVSRLQPAPPRGLQADRSVAEAVEVMRAEGVGCLLICRGEQLVGIFTERDLLARVLAPARPLCLPVADCMTPAPVTVQPKDPISSALRRMLEGGYRHLPVVDAANRPIGILSIKRIVHYVVEHFPSTVYNLPPDPDAVPRDREGA
jgi:signal-transduction protein with cAMP-binding, CBS, and nucleotidyltransferase domain